MIGNEPFIETQSTQSGQPLIDFYETMANDVIGYWSSHAEAEHGTQLYMGAFTRLDLVANRTPAVQWMLQYIASHQELSGPDLHMHMPNFAANQLMLSYVLPWLRPDQKFLVTEFSLVLLWYQHLSDPVSPDFTSRYNLPTPLEIYQFINLALQNPVPDAVAGLPDVLSLVHVAQTISFECLPPLSRHREARCGQRWHVSSLD